MDRRKPAVAIIILNWNGVADTLALLKNFESVNYPNFSVLVVDNGSVDDSVDRLTRYSKQHKEKKEQRFTLSLLPLPKNLGYAEGNNRGLSEARQLKADYYLLLNNDTVLSPDFLDQLVMTAESNPTFGAFGPTIGYADSQGRSTGQIWYAGGWLNFFAGGAHHHTAKPTANTSILETDFITGCCLLLRAKAVNQLDQLFDPAFFAYGEDVDLCLRLNHQGWKLGYVPAAQVWHKLAASSGGPKSSNFWYYNVRNNWLVMSRYASWYHWPIFILYFLFYKPVLLSIGGAILRPRPDKWLRLQAIAQGTVDAIIGRFGPRPTTQ